MQHLNMGNLGARPFKDYKNTCSAHDEEITERRQTVDCPPLSLQNAARYAKGTGGKHDSGKVWDGHSRNGFQSGQRAPQHWAHTRVPWSRTQRKGWKRVR